MNKVELEENVGKALVAHSQWKVRLRHAVEMGALPKPARDIACDNQCGLGIWLEGLKKDPSSANDEGVQAVLKAHTHFHKEAGRIAAMVEQGNNAKAGEELDGPAYAMATDMLKHSLINLRQQARN